MFHNYNGTPIIQTIQMWPEILELGKQEQLHANYSLLSL